MSETVQQSSIKLYLISGFLGAGKTTFIRNLLQQSNGGKIGLIVNEFGQISIDGKLLEDSEIQLVEVNNGSIFCACLKKDFVQALRTFSAQPIETLLIESSGLADPSSMNTILRELAPYLQRPYDHQGSICLVDCAAFYDYAGVLTAVENQVKVADLLLLNKTDLVSPAELAELREVLAELNPRAPRYETTFAAVPPDLISAVLNNSGFEAESVNRLENRPLTMVLPLPEPVSAAKLQAFCEKLRPHVWRAKGFALSTEGWLQVDITAGQIEVVKSPLNILQAPQDNHLVMIWRPGQRQNLAGYREELMGPSW